MGMDRYLEGEFSLKDDGRIYRRLCWLIREHAKTTIEGDTIHIKFDDADHLEQARKWLEIEAE